MCVFSRLYDFWRSFLNDGHDLETCNTNSIRVPVTPCWKYYEYLYKILTTIQHELTWRLTFYQLPYLTSCNTALYVNEMSKFDNMKTQNMMHHEMLGQYFINLFVSALPNGHIIVFFIYLIQQYKKRVSWRKKLSIVIFANINLQVTEKSSKIKSDSDFIKLQLLSYMSIKFWCISWSDMIWIEVIDFPT